MNIPKCTANTSAIRNLPTQPAISSTEFQKAFDTAGQEIKDYINDKLVGALDTELTEKLDEMSSTLKTQLDTTVAEVNQEITDLKEEINTTVTSKLEEVDTKITSMTEILNGAMKIVNYSKTFSYAGNHVYTEWTLNAPTGYVFGGVINKYRPNPSDMSKDAVISCNKQPGETSSIAISMKYTGNDAGNCIIGFSVLWVKSDVIS